MRFNHWFIIIIPVNMRKITANQIAESIDIKMFRKEYAGTEYSFDSSEVFYKNEQER